MPRPYSSLKFQIVEVGAVLDRPAEYHENEDDVFVVLKGEMHFTLGGEATEPVTTKDNLTWVSSVIIGGKKFTFKEGEGTVIPAGTWHQWSVPESATYAVAKVPALEGKVALS